MYVQNHKSLQRCVMCMCIYVHMYTRACRGPRSESSIFLACSPHDLCWQGFPEPQLSNWANLGLPKGSVVSASWIRFLTTRELTPAKLYGEGPNSDPQTHVASALSFGPSPQSQPAFWLSITSPDHVLFTQLTEMNSMLFFLFNCNTIKSLKLSAPDFSKH